MSEVPDPDGYVDPAEGDRVRAARADAEAYVQHIRAEVAAGRYCRRTRKCYMCREPVGEKRTGFCSRHCRELRQEELDQQESEHERELWLIRRHGYDRTV